MDAETQLDDLLSCWQGQLALGKDIPATVLCQDCPELAPELERRQRALRQMQELANTHYFSATADGATTGTSGTSSTSHSSQVIGSYEILEELGRGGMGVVYKARQTALKRLVAIKMILVGEHASAEERERFRAEAEVVARLGHPNIVEIYEVGEADGRPYFSLEFVDGGNLAKQLAGTPMPPPKAAALVETLARAMHHAHVNGIVHRDLKPGNVLLTAAGTPKITDFGLAKQLDMEGRTTTGAIIGTPSYMAPEQAAGAKNLGPACDVYALGSLLYECLTGRPPFRAASPMETLQQVLHYEPVPPRRINADLPRDLETICLKCLHKQASHRYWTAGELAGDLRRFLSGEPIRARPVGPIERTRRWCGRNPVVAALLTLVAVIVLGSSVLAWTLFAHARAAQQEAELQAEKNRASELLARQQADLAEQNAKKARTEAENARLESERAGKIATFLTQLFDAVDPVGLNSHTFGPDPARGAKLTAKEVLDRGTEKLRKELADEPKVRAPLLATIGAVYRNLGLYDKAQELLEEALKLNQQLRAERPLELAGTLFELGWLEQYRGNYDLTEKRYAEAHALAAKSAEGAPLISRIQWNRAWMCLETVDLAEGERLFREILAERQQRLGKDHPDTAIAQLGVAAVLIGKERDLLEASERVTLALATLRRHHGDDGFFIGLGHTQSALVSYLFGKTEAAEKQLLRTAEIIRTTGAGERNLYMALVYGMLGRMKELNHDDKASLAYFRKFMDVVEGTVGLGHPMFAVQLGEFHYARTLTRCGKYSEACKFYETVLENQKKRWGPEHFLVGMSLEHYGLVARQAGDQKKAEKLLHQSYNLVKTAARDHPRARRALPSVVDSLAQVIGDRDLAAAKPFYREARELAAAKSVP
jgi:tetratricopeptide (TPR) repeat protein/predicted Ser/Thr protein kinase